MNEEEKLSVTEATPEAAAPAPESDNAQEEQAESAAQSKKRNDVEYNWAEARRAIQERDRKLQDYEEQLKRLQKPTAESDEDDLGKLAEDDLITVKQLRKFTAKAAQKAAEQAVKQHDAANVDERLALKFEDFSEVVTTENIELLKQTEPELAVSLYHNPDPYKQGVAAYKLLKRLGMGANVANSAEKEKALKNSQKPVSVNAVTKSSAIGNAHKFENGLTPDLKKQLWSEMQQAMKGH